MLLHTIGRMGGPGTTDAFTARYIFPGGYNPALSEIVGASESVKLISSDIETLRLHYAYTLRHWYDRTVAAKDAIVALYDERFYRMWTFYLAGAMGAFNHGGMCVYQIQYIRDRRTLPITRDYIAEAGAGAAGEGMSSSPFRGGTMRFSRASPSSPRASPAARPGVLRGLPCRRGWCRPCRTSPAALRSLRPV